MGAVGWGGMSHLAAGEDVLACKAHEVWEPAVTIECKAPGVYRVQFKDGSIRDLPATALSKSPLVDYALAKAAAERDDSCTLL
eukprot:1512956-Amphidinium_carterae.1